DFVASCQPTRVFKKALRRWGRFLQVIRASGRRTILLLAPDKSTIYPEHLPKRIRPFNCALSGKRRFWNLVEHHAPAGVIGLRRAVLAEKARRGSTPVYWRKDTHWNTLAAVRLLVTALDKLGGPVRVAPGDVVAAPAHRISPDLT